MQTVMEDKTEIYLSHPGGGSYSNPRKSLLPPWKIHSTPTLRVGV
jgi:hypothetical protein